MRPWIALAVALSTPLSARAGDTKLLDAAAAALADFDADKAVSILERAKAAGPYRWSDHARLYEQLGVAYAYLERPEPALVAFDMLLTIDPARAISYTLSPKVTFLFEKARLVSRERPQDTLQVTWRPDLKVADEIPIDVEIVEDPMLLMKKAVLGWRLKGSPEFETTGFELLPKGQRRTVTLPPAAPASTRRESVELYIAALDDKGNEVLLWGSPTRPRELQLDYDPPVAWYNRWWVWTIAGVAIAAGATAAAVAVTREPGPTVPGTFGVTP